MADRILYVCHGHPDFVPGGTEIFAHDLFREVRDSGQAEAMFLGCVSGLHRNARVSGSLQAVGRSRDEALLCVGAFDRFMLGHIEAAPVVTALSELLTTFRPDVVHFHHFALIGLEPLALIRRVLPAARIVATLHDYHPICANEGLMVKTGVGTNCALASPDACHGCFPAIAPSRFAARNLHVRNMLSLVDRFIAPSRFLRDRFVAWGVAADRIEVIENALPDAPIVSPEPSRPRLGFGFFGNIAPHKGVLVALGAIKRLVRDVPDATLRLHGGLNFQNASFRGDFDAALTATDGAAVHCGPYRRDELPALMAGIDWVVVPSTWCENAPLVVLEAFRHRRPVICSDLGGLAELVSHDVNGLHVHPGDAAALARAMQRASSENNLWERLSAAAPAVPRMTNAAARHMELYRTLLERKEAQIA